MRPTLPSGWLPVASLLLALAACQPSAPAEVPLPREEASVRNGQGNPATEDTLRVRVGESATHGDLGVRVTGATDSRCPANVMCVRYGEATLRLRLAVRDTTVEVTLTTPATPTAPDRAVIDRYTVRAVNLEPYPGTSPVEPPIPARTAVLVVTPR